MTKRFKWYSGFVHKIETLSAKQIMDSRGNATIEVTLGTAGGSGIASVPSGASVGAHEARVVEPAVAVAQINTEVSMALSGKEFDQKSLDEFLIKLDGTPDRRRLGGNAILGISLAFARAAAAEQKVELYKYFGNLAGNTTFALPMPMFNVLNGGKHAKGGIAIQECMLVPVGVDVVGAQVQAARDCVAALKVLLEKNGYGTEMGDEGGYEPALTGNDEALDLLVSAISAAGYAGEIKLAIDVAASSMPAFDKETMSKWYADIVKKYPLISIEDPFTEDDWESFAVLRASALDVLVVGDDLTATNAGRITLAAQKNAINAVIIKPNQVGTVSETIDAVAAVRAQGWMGIASHRSGETLDTWIADVAVGLGCGYIKAGAPTKPERTAKYDRLIAIEKTLA